MSYYFRYCFRNTQFLSHGRQCRPGNSSWKPLCIGKIEVSGSVFRVGNHHLRLFLAWRLNESRWDSLRVCNTSNRKTGKQQNEDLCQFLHQLECSSQPPGCYYSTRHLHITAVIYTGTLSDVRVTDDFSPKSISFITPMKMYITKSNGS